jgi:hypothetical protein
MGDIVQRLRDTWPVTVTAGEVRNDCLEAADRIDALELALRDIAEGRGMFGARAKDDLIWAMSHAGKAINLKETSR